MVLTIQKYLFTLILLIFSSTFAFSATRDLGFITSQQPDGTVSVVNVFNNNVVKTIPVGSFPFAIGAAPDGKHVYVGNRFDGNVSVIDTTTLLVVDTVFVGDQPFGIAVSPDSSLVYVTTINSPGLKVIQTSDNSVIFDMAFLANFQSIAFHPSGEFVYISDAAADTLEVFRTSDNTVVASIPMTPNSNEINAVDLTTKSVKSISVDGNTSGVDITPDGQFAYASGGDADVVYVIDTATDIIVDTVPVLNPSSFGTFFVSIERTPIPTLSEWGLIAMAGVLGIVGFIVVKRRELKA